MSGLGVGKSRIPVINVSPVLRSQDLCIPDKCNRILYVRVASSVCPYGSGSGSS